jgi:hypothetical protein
VQSAFTRQELYARKAGISIGQYNAAMRSLPAQFTDIATQLAGGQSPFLILLQQGGQIKDQFGGVKVRCWALLIMQKRWPGLSPDHPRDYCAGIRRGASRL